MPWASDCGAGESCNVVPQAGIPFEFLHEIARNWNEIRFALVWENSHNS